MFEERLLYMACLKNDRPAEWNYSVFKETIIKRKFFNEQSIQNIACLKFFY